MKKSRGIITLIVTFILIAGLSFAAVYGVDSSHRGSARNIKQGLDLAGGVSITYQVVGDEQPSSEDMSDTVYKLQKRVEQYSTESQVYQEGSDRINVEIPGVSDAEAVLEELGQPGSLLFIMEYDDEGNQNYIQGLGVGDDGELDFVYTLARSLEEIEASGSVVLTGTDVKGADAGYHTNPSTGNNELVVDLTLTDEGTEKFAAATAKAVGRMSIGIYYDGGFVSVPSVNSVISDGKAQISGMKDYAEAENLASYIRIGGLKLELSELSSNVVGAQLGEKAISTSLYAGAIGLALVIIFMIAAYRIPGVASALALVLYVILTILGLNFLNITLTLPGIAGIILSIGMAVDANVIIFARIKEEIATGKTVRSAIDIGFKKALSAIVDGNVTTFIAAVVLMIMGTGSVKGFAQTLALGIVLSMFTSLVITKQILRALFAVGLRSEKFYGRAKERKSINFLQKKTIFFAVSVCVIVLGFVFMGINKGTKGNIMNYSLEFSGGTTFTVPFPQDYSLEEIDEQIKPAIAGVTGDNQIQASKIRESADASGDSYTVSIKTKTLDKDMRAKVIDVLQTQFGVTQEVEYQNISAIISREMRSDAVVSVVIATICMLFYIWFRFKDVRFAASAVLALVHDVLVVLAFYVITRISVGNTFIACMLTIVGYSINATIVIFDRVRENLRTPGPKADVAEIVNRSITQTLTRSIYTSLTTFIMVFVLFIMGVSSIRDFALPLMAGIVCGAYSSICITGALWYVMRTKLVGREKE